MKRWTVLLGFAAMTACASTTYYAAPIPEAPPNTTPREPVIREVRAELPPQRFEPPAHEPRQHPDVVVASLSSLPPLSRSGNCVRAGAVPEAKPSRGKVAGGSSYVPFDPTPPTSVTNDAGGFASSSGADEPASPGSPSARKRAASDQAGPKTSAAPPADTSAAEEASAGFAPESSVDASEAAPPAQREPMTDVSRSARERRRDHREARRAKRSAKHERGRSAASTPEPEADAVALAPAEPAIITRELPPLQPPSGEGWGQATYLSNDDSMSLSSAQRVLYAIDHFAPLPPEHIRKHELLNYFAFQTAPVAQGHDFSVHAELAPSRIDPGVLDLALAVRGRTVGRQGRRNAVLTLVVDRSGSMRDEGRMNYLKRGLLRMVRELKRGDMVHLVTFDHRVCAPLQNFVVGRDDPQALTRAIHALTPSGYTNLHAGLNRGYELADATYQPRYTNRVLLITDALANRGATDPRTLALVSDFYDARRIRLSGIGVGSDFNDALLDRLTETGRGAYVFLGSPREVDAVFGARFTSLIETIANDTHFRLHLPKTLRMLQFHGEEASIDRAEVQAVHFFADTSQLFFAQLELWRSEWRDDDQIMLEVEYLHPETGQPMQEFFPLDLGAMRGSAANVRKAELIVTFIDAIAAMSQREPPSTLQQRAGGWVDDDAARECEDVREQLASLTEVSRDPEVKRILALWNGYCARFGSARPPRPTRKAR